jgi:hypothetical protein
MPVLMRIARFRAVRDTSRDTSKLRPPLRGRPIPAPPSRSVAVPVDALFRVACDAVPRLRRVFVTPPFRLRVKQRSSAPRGSSRHRARATQSTRRRRLRPPRFGTARTRSRETASRPTGGARPRHRPAGARVCATTRTTTAARRSARPTAASRRGCARASTCAPPRRAGSVGNRGGRRPSRCEGWCRRRRCGSSRGSGLDRLGLIAGGVVEVGLNRGGGAAEKAADLEPSRVRRRP